MHPIRPVSQNESHTSTIRHESPRAAAASAHPHAPQTTNGHIEEEDTEEIRLLVSLGYSKPLPPPPEQTLSSAALLRQARSITVLNSKTHELAMPMPSAPPQTSRVQLQGSLSARLRTASRKSVLSLPTTKPLSSSEMPDLQEILSSITSPALALANLEQNQFNYTMIDRMISLTIQGQMTEDALFLLLEPYETQEKLKIILPQVCQSLRKLDASGGIFLRLFEKSAELTDKSAPFRSESAGVSIFSYLLQESLEEMLGKLPFVAIAYTLICEKFHEAKKRATGSESPDQKLINSLCKAFIEKIALLLAKKKSRSIMHLCRHFLKTAESQKFTLVNPKLLLLNFLFLRCICPQLTVVSAKLRDRPQINHLHLQVANYLSGISRAANDAVNTHELKDDNLLLIINSLLPAQSPDLDGTEETLGSLKIN